MSADNFYLVRRHPKGGFTPLMGFASEERIPRACVDSPQFATVKEALTSVKDEWSEYGTDVDPECFRSDPGVYSWSWAHAWETDDDVSMEILNKALDTLSVAAGVEEAQTEEESYGQGTEKLWKLQEPFSELVSASAEQVVLGYQDWDSQKQVVLSVPARALQSPEGVADWVSRM